MTGLGDRLKEARTAKGFTLEDLQTITKIQKRYLSGIENEDYSMMPGSFYVRAFIKQYAEAVGLDSDEMLSMYKNTSSDALPEAETGQLTSTTLTRKRGLSNSNRLNEIMPKIIVALFIIVIIVVVWVLWQKTSSTKPMDDLETEQTITLDNKKPDSSKTDGNPAEDEDESVEEPETETETEPDKVEQSLVHEGMTGETATYTLTDADAFLLEIKTSDDSWIGVRDSSQQERLPNGARVLKAGESVEVDVSDSTSARIRVGRTQSTEIYVNGELLDYESDLVTQNIMIEYKKGQ
ncbi:helix-turn-helix domain-containing protein [Filibacter tadaridae]|uniref:helix-turn-helix domain-containing protein n=1 Tax=Filibacter tadaridae TaxID=2483811 RepID=UPI00135A57B2|nr:helix-turn-helix domain-containing protein [Filibacter tadaridae]